MNLKSFRILFVTALCSFVLSCSSGPQKTDPSMNNSNKTDSYIWLENVSSPEAMKWIAPHNKKSLDLLTADSRYKKIEDEVREIVTSKDRIPMPSVRDGKYRNFWQDHEHVRGIVRETTEQEYKKKNPKWETILDIDALNQAGSNGKKTSWVWKGNNCLPPDYNRCLVGLSEGGKDSEIAREFDISKRAFFPVNTSSDSGFEVPEGKHTIAWLDENTLMIGTDFGPGTLTDSGYPKQVRIWKRGTPLSSAKLIFEGQKSDVSVSGWRNFRPESAYTYVQRSPNFFEEETSLYEGDGKLTRIPFPTTAQFNSDFQGYLLAKLRKDWKTSRREFKAGSLVSLPVSEISNPKFENSLELVYEPDSRSTLTFTAPSKSYLFLGILKNVHGQVLMASHSQSGWTHHSVPLPSRGMATLSDVSPFTDTVLASYQDFTVPTTLYKIDAAASPLKPEVLKRLPEQYNAKNVVVEQLESVSKDGTKIPYFLIHKKGIKLDGKNPTLLYGYGGFELSMTPYYFGTTGKVWIERGGVYAIANIRGGAEFGPRWHEAALKENRQRAYDDFASVAQDLINRKITSPRHLGIEGGSNGGLLVGVAFTQHPELFHAVICGSALLDMLRYHKLPPGASWMGEYGNPDDPKDAEFIVKYSPYQNLKPGVKYPKVFFVSSTADDRVQPGHSRKMVARMEEYGNDVLLFENTEGGHSASADLEQTIKKLTLEYTYLFQQLK
jgi:prolyl oligopeptidase